MTASIDVSYTGSAFQNTLNTRKSYKRTVVEARLVNEDEASWIVGTYVRNLFDEEQVSNRFSATGGADHASTWELKTLGVFYSEEFLKWLCFQVR